MQNTCARAKHVFVIYFNSEKSLIPVKYNCNNDDDDDAIEFSLNYWCGQFPFLFVLH